MTLDEIKSAVLAGKTVHWCSNIYNVTVDKFGQWHIVCSVNGHATGLTRRDNGAMNEDPAEFYIPTCIPIE